MGGFVFPVYVRVKDDGSVMEFSTQAEIQGYLEAIDVENGEYEAWDADGRCVGLGVGKTRSEWLIIAPIGGQLSEGEFAEIRAKAEKRGEYQPLTKRLYRWIGSRIKGLNAKG